MRNRVDGRCFIVWCSQCSDRWLQLVVASCKRSYFTAGGTSTRESKGSCESASSLVPHLLCVECWRFGIYLGLSISLFFSLTTFFGCDLLRISRNRFLWGVAKFVLPDTVSRSVHECLHNWSFLTDTASDLRYTF